MWNHLKNHISNNEIGFFPGERTRRFGSGASGYSICSLFMLSLPRSAIGRRNMAFRYFGSDRMMVSDIKTPSFTKLHRLLNSIIYSINFTKLFSASSTSSTLVHPVYLAHTAGRYEEILRRSWLAIRIDSEQFLFYVLLLTPAHISER